MVTSNFRKNLIDALIGLTLFFIAFNVKASNGSDSSSVDAILTKQQEDTSRKRIPSQHFMVLIYSDTMLSLTSNYYEGEFSIQLENTETGEILTIPSIFVGDKAYIDLQCGQYMVSAIRTDGLTFYGLLEVTP